MNLIAVVGEKFYETKLEGEYHHDHKSDLSLTLSSRRVYKYDLDNRVLVGHKNLGRL